MAFKLYLDSDGKPQFDDRGVPLFIQDGATEPAAIDVNGMIDDNRAKKTAADAAKKERDALAAQIRAFEGIDPETARAALDKMKLLDDGKLLEAGKVEEIRQKAVAEERQKAESLSKALEEAKAEGVKAVQEKEQVINDLLVKKAFFESDFLRERTVLLAEFAHASLGKHFTVEYQDGTPVVIAKDSQGNTLFSPSNPGRNASPEEAIRLLIEQHPQRDSLLKATAANGGSGTQPGGGYSQAKATNMNQLKSPEAKAEFIKEHGLDAFKQLPKE